MRVSRRLDYGLRALVDLAVHGRTTSVFSREIAARQGIPEAILPRVLGDLARAGWVRGTRGPGGGHQLLVDPATLTVRDVFVAIEGGLLGVHPHAIGEDPPGCASVVHSLWHEMEGAALDHLRTVSVADLVARTKATDAADGYAI